MELNVILAIVSLQIRPLERKIIFVHQPKTGGANFAQILKNSYGRKAVYRDKDRAKERLNEYLLSKGEKVERHEDQFYDRLKYKVIYGHFSPLKYRRRFPKAFYMTFFRDPVQRIVSHYHYWKRAEIVDENSMHPLQKELLENDYSIEQFSSIVQKNRLEKNYHNNYVMENFNFSGIMEEYDLSVELLKRMHLPELIDFKEEVINVNPEKNLTEKYKVENQEFFDNLFEEDIKNYNKVKDQFHKNCRKQRLI